MSWLIWVSLALFTWSALTKSRYGANTIYLVAELFLIPVVYAPLTGYAYAGASFLMIILLAKSIQAITFFLYSTVSFVIGILFWAGVVIGTAPNYPAIVPLVACIVIIVRRIIASKSKAEVGL